MTNGRRWTAWKIHHCPFKWSQFFSRHEKNWISYKNKAKVLFLFHKNKIFLLLSQSQMCVSAKFKQLIICYQWGVAPICSLCHKVLIGTLAVVYSTRWNWNSPLVTLVIMYLIRFLAKAILPQLLVLVRSTEDPVVSNFIHFQVMETTILFMTFNLSRDLCCGTVKSCTTRGKSFDFLVYKINFHGNMDQINNISCKKCVIKCSSKWHRFFWTYKFRKCLVFLDIWKNVYNYVFVLSLLFYFCLFIYF